MLGFGTGLHPYFPALCNHVISYMYGIIKNGPLNYLENNAHQIHTNCVHV